MAMLNKSENGLIFYDDFKEPTLLWTLSPSDANSLKFGENGLTMSHHRRYTTYTMTEPEAEEYSCIVELDHIPRNFEDIGGVIIIANNKEYAECQSFLATGPSELGNSNLIQADINQMIQELLDDSYVRYTLNEVELTESSSNEENNNTSGDESNNDDTESPFIDTFYRFIKFTKQKYKYIFWASEDGIHWIEVGNVAFENSGVIGFFLYGTTNQDLIDNSHFNIKSISIYSSRYLTIDAISRDNDFEIINGDGEIILRTDSISYAHIINRSNNRCLINTTMLPMPIKNAHIRIYPKKDYDTTTAIYEFGDNVYGGDVFTLEHDIKAFIYGKEISPTEIFDLGSLVKGNHYIPMTIKSYEDYDIPNVKLKVTAYSEYYAGYEEVELALALDGMHVLNNELNYSKKVTIPMLKIGESALIYIKLTDKMMDMFYHAASIYRFKIAIE